MRKPVWANDIERQSFIETNCRRCFQPDEASRRMGITEAGCPHLARADLDKMPKAWTKRRGNDAVLGKTYKCADFAAKPPVNRRKTTVVETEPMFDAPLLEVGLVPVENWPPPEAFGRKSKNDKGDHA